MALNSPNSSNFSTALSLGLASNTNEALTVKGMGQLGLNQRITKVRKSSLTAKERSCLVHGGSENNTESIIRASQIVRAKLVHAVSSTPSPVSSNNVVVVVADKKKAIEILQAKLLCASAFAPKTSPTSLRPISLSHRLTSTPPLKTRRGFLNDDDFAYSLCPSPLSVCFPHETSTLQNHVRGGDTKYDGRMHSYPYKKNGPYTCPKCGHVFETSQRFAAHVSSSHYKYETKSERKKRLMAKIRKRNLRIEWVSGGLTVVPDDAPPTSAFAYSARNNNNVAPPPPVRVVKVEGQSGMELQLAPPPGWEKLTAGGGAVKIKLEPVAS
uniref:C2H2-type domain-containing protein n=1 Tax=Glycine max TaxID=3847 RepID=C6TM62_SOYBN|nr:unknown [Glycine max]